jgi:hypothetical protein
MKDNNSKHPKSRETNDDNIASEKSEKVHVYTIKVNAMLPKGSKDHRPLWFIKELLLQLHNTDPEACFMTEQTTDEH